MTNKPGNNETSNMTNDSDINGKKNFLLNQDNFELLMNVQREIEEKTEMRPTFKKLINALVTEESLNNIKIRMIEQMC